MRYIFLALFSSLALVGCPAKTCDMCGRWQSNADRTLAEMEMSPLLSDKQRRFFRNNFYGRLIVEIRETHSRAYFPDEFSESVAAWEPWQEISRSGDSVTVKETIAGETLIRSVTLHGNCYRVDQPNLGFGEWFCRTP